MLTFGHLFAAFGDYQIAGDEPAIPAIVIDSRQATPGSMFVAFAGSKYDGHDFVADAFERGAVAALVERRDVAQTWPSIDLQHPVLSLPLLPCCFVVDDTQLALQQLATYWRRQHQLSVVGVTGSIGKSSTKELIYTVLSQRFRVLKSEGNLNNEIGLPLSVLRLTGAEEFAVLEMGMYELGEISQLCQIARPDIGVVTTVGPVHMERLGNVQTIARAKRELVEALPSDGWAVLNYDDPLVMEMASHSNAQVLTYGINRGADLWADDIETMGLNGVRCTLHHGQEQLRVQVPLLGRHSVHTVLRAAAIGILAGLGWDDLVRGLQDPRAQLRLVAVKGPEGSLIIDDTYNSSPASALAALNLLKELDGRRVAVLGDMLELGPAEKDAHELVGRRAAAVADVLITVGPRAQLLAEAAGKIGMSPNAIHILTDAQSALEFLTDFTGPNDVTLIKGSRGVGLEHIVTALATQQQRVGA